MQRKRRLTEHRINIASSIRATPGTLAQPRALGSLAIHVARGPNGTALKGLRQSGSLKVLFPGVADRLNLTGVWINTAGGITGGDRFAIKARASAGSRLTLTTQAAERIYRARGEEVGEVSTQLSAAAGARLDWLPQETILYDRSSLRRSLRIDIANDAVFLGVEPLVFGRAAMGERLRHIAFNDNVRLFRSGELVFADAIRLTGDAEARLGSCFSAAKSGAIASIVYAAPDADLFLPRLRTLLSGAGGVSLIRPGLLFARLLASDSHLLRQSLIPLIEILRRAPIPRTWMQ